MTTKQALYVSGLNVSFGNFAVLKNLSWTVDFGEVRGVIGPNGAGKTTLLDSLTGKTKYQSGDIYVKDTVSIKNLTEIEIAKLGIGRKFQKPSVFSGLSGFQNLEIALRAGHSRSIYQPKLTSRQREKIHETSELIGLSSELSRNAGTLAHGQKQWLEIGMLIIAEPSVILLDEPVAGMNSEERGKTAELISNIRGPNIAVVVVEHDMEFVGQVCDTVTVLHDGRVMIEGPMGVVQADPQVIDVYLGKEAASASSH